MLRIGLIPLDERPVNTRYPALIAGVAGVELHEPPPALLSDIRQGANTPGLVDWLRETAPRVDMLIVSIETFGHGGLIASRTTDTGAAAIAQTLDVLREIKQAHPQLIIYGFNVITRISFSNNNFEEALYWSDYGSRLYTFSQLFDRQQQGQASPAEQNELAALTAEIPAAVRQDFIQRRLRNHIVNLLVLQLAAEHIFDLLVISSDDTSEYGFGSREKSWLTEWVTRLGLSNVLLYPGADEVGSALLARAINHWGQRQPSFYLHYAIPGDEELVAPFEDGPVRLTLERQIHAVGGVVSPDADSADFIVAVNTPSRHFPEKMTPYDAAAQAERDQRTPFLIPFVGQIQQWLDNGKHVIVTDVAYPNGADPALVDLLRETVDLPRLAAYGAWNTAGNTIGVALAQGVAAALVTTPEQQTAHARFLLHHFIEDWGYQYHVRRDHTPDFGGQSLDAQQLDTLKASIEQGLQARLEQLPGFAGKWRITPGSVRLPWRRLFEVDFDLEEIE